MKHALKITVSKNPAASSIASCKKMTIRQKLLKLFLGDKTKLMVIVPGDEVAELAICDLGRETAHETV